MKCYDTNVFINIALINKSVRNKILDEFEKKECIIPRSIEQELLLNHFPELSIRLHILLKNCKPSFDAMLNSHIFEQFEKEYAPIAKYVRNNSQKFKISKEIISYLIDEISYLTLALQGFKCFFPQTRKEFEQLEETPTQQYVNLCRLASHKDNKHLALLELYGEQINVGNKGKVIKIKFISCDKKHIVGFLNKFKIKKNYKFIEPIDCRNYFSSELERSFQ